MKHTMKYAIALLIILFYSIVAGCTAQKTPETVKTPTVDQEARTTLGDYYNNLDYSCKTNDDCAVKDVGNCCGYYPKCLNKKQQTSPEIVRETCKNQKLASICGFSDIKECGCRNNRCEPTNAGQSVY